MFESIDKLLLLLHFELAHDLANRELERAQAADVGDVDVQKTLERGPLTNFGRRIVVVVQHLFQAGAQALEDALRDKDAELVFEVI